MAEYKSLYKWSLNEAIRNNEKDLWRESYKENCDCARSIEKAIAKNHDGRHLNTDFMDDILEQYGFNRVNFVLANTVKQKSHDGRFSQENKDWANQFYIPHDEVRWHYTVDSHPGLVDMCVNNVRKQWQAKGLFDKNHCEQDESIDYAGKVLILKASQLKEEYQKPEFQLFCATGGFGCNPSALGRKVFGFFLFDGEETHFSRNQFFGVIRDECLPDWAKEKLLDIQSSESEGTNDQSPIMGGM